MLTEVETNNTQSVQASKSSLNKALIISLVSALLLLAVLTCQVIYIAIKYDRIHRGVYVGDIHIGGLERKMAKSILEQRYGKAVDTGSITFAYGSTRDSLPLSRLNVQVDIQKAVNQAYSIGRKRNPFKSIQEIITAYRYGIKVKIPVKYDSDLLEKEIERIHKNTHIAVKEVQCNIEENRALFYPGKSGQHIDREKAFDDAEKLILSLKGGRVEIPIIITPPSAINVDKYYSLITREAKNADLKVENNKVTIIPHVVGKAIDRRELEEIAFLLEQENCPPEVELPIQTIVPEITTELVTSQLFKDTLATYVTRFSKSDLNNINRSENIAIAVSKINGTVLAPGEVFSFNTTVGERTVEAGYKEAYTFVGGKVVPGLGGGICQVSSTLYAAALYADLEVVERRNHMFVVSYIPKGFDATVVYGQQDLKFKNSTKWPLLIECWITKDNSLYFRIKGTNENPGRKVEYKTVTRKETNYKTIYIKDSTLPEGKTVVKTKGYKGCVVDTYKIVKENGIEVENSKISTSTYIPLDEEVRIGTKKAAVENPPSQDTNNTESGTAPSDGGGSTPADAENSGGTTEEI